VSDYVLNVPDDVVAAAREIAEATAQPVEDVLLNRLKTVLSALPPDEEAELDALRHLSDDALWTIARERMADSVQEHMQALMDKNSLGTITPDEYSELEQLVDRGQRLMLRKSEAAAILTRRGYQISLQDLSAGE
jgi:hypothetical protein